MDRKTLLSPAKGLKSPILGIAALVLMVIVGLSYREGRRYSRANAEAAQTREIVTACDRVLSNLIDAETGQRGFLLTGENRYLEPYNQGIQALPNELATLKELLAARQSESANATQMDTLVNQRLTQFRQTIEVRRTRGAAAALAVVLSDQGKRTMDAIRALCAQIQRNENSAQGQASIEGETAAQTVLFVSVAGSLVLLFLLAFGLEPFMSSDPRSQGRSWPLRYGAAVLAVVAAVLIRMPLSPLIGPTAVPFITFFPAVLFASWFGGFRAGVVAILLSVVASDYYFIEPAKTFLILNRGDQITLIVFVVVGFGMALLSHSQSRAVERAGHAENAERDERQRFETTLASIGDAVIATDADGGVTFANKIALSLVKWPEAEISGKPLDEIFRIVNEFSRATVESPVAKVLREGRIVGLANHTILLARDGTEVPIDDSAAPIRGADGATQGTVLVFRDITERRRAEGASRLLASIVESSDDAIISKNLTGIVTSWNRGAERMLGYSAEEMIGQPISVLSAPDRLDEMQGILKRISQGEHIDQFQTIRRSKSGKLIHVSLTVSPVHDASGNITGASKILRDITAQIEAQREIAEQRERLRVTLSSIGDAVIATDTAGCVEYLNPVAEQLTGWSAEDAAGRPLEEVFQIVNEHSRMRVENPVESVLREGRVVGLANHTLLIARDGREVFIDDSAAPIRDQTGSIRGSVLVFRDNGDRRSIERELRESEERYRATFDNAAVGIAHVGLDGRWLRFNDTVCAITGYSREELPTKTFADITHPDDIEADWSLARRVAAGEIPTYSLEKRYIRKNGVTVWVNLAVSVLRDASGAPQYFISIIQDITARRHAEERFHLAVEAAPNGMVAVNQEGIIVLVNSYTERLFGYTRTELLGNRVEMLVPVRFRASHEVDREGFLHRPESRAMGAGRELYGLRKDGTEFPIEIGLNPIKTDRETLVLSSIVDVTERRQAEATSRLLASVVQSSVDAIISKDLDGVITSWNSGAEGMFGYSAEEMIGRTIAVLIPPGQVNETPTMLERVKRGELIEQYEATRQTKSGNLITVSITWSPIHDAHGRTLGVSKVVRDITERKQMEEQRLELVAKERALTSERALRAMEGELARVVRALSVGELATSIAHEINQPLAGVVTNAEAGLRWLSGETPNVLEARESLALVTRDGNRASSVIRRIREFLRKGEQVTGSLEINEVVQETVALARAELQKRQIVLRTDLADELPRIQGDRVQLQQVILNLIMNGSDAMTSAEGAKEMVVRSDTADDGGIVVSVRDSGVGVSPEEMQRMFDAFFTTKPTGMGMGLSISRSIIEAHAGRIWATSNDGPGLTVQFRLPAEASSHAASNPS